MPPLTFQASTLPPTSAVRASDLPAAEADHTWTGCDEHNSTQHYRAKIELGTKPFGTRSVHLRWRRKKKDVPVSVGVFDLDLDRMVRDGLARSEHESRFVALIVHEAVTNRLVIRLNDGAPSIVLGRLA